MRRILVLAVLAIGLGLGSLPVVNAQDLELNIGPDGPKLRLRDDCDPRREHCRDDRDRSERRDGDERRSDRRGCTPERALDKAERMGMRRARIDRIGRSIIDVRGRSHDGGRMMVSFGRWDRRCPIVDY